MTDPTTIFALPGPDLDESADIEQAVLPLRDRIEEVLAARMPVPIGAILPYAGSVLPDEDGTVEFAWADGSLVNRGTYATLFARAGHAYNGGVDPGSGAPGQGGGGAGPLMRLPDKRGRVSVGADSFGQGPANRLPNSNRARGQNGGEERHLNTAAESGTNSNGATDNDGGHSHTVDNLSVVDDFNLADPKHIAMTDSGGIQGALGTGVNDGLHSHSLAARNADAAHNNLQPYEVDLYIVRIL